MTWKYWKLLNQVVQQNQRYENAHNWSSVHDMDLKFLQEIGNFMIYNFGSHHKVRFPE